MLSITFKICSKISSNLFNAKYRRIFRHVNSPGASRRIFVVIPEIAEDRNYLNINSITSLSPYDVFVEVSRCVQNFDTNLSTLAIMLNKYHAEQTYDYDNTILKICNIFREMDSKFKYIRYLSYASDDRITKLIVYCLCNKILVASQQLLNINSIGCIINELNNMELTGFQQKIVEMMKINYARLGGYLPKNKMDAMRHNINELLRHQFKFNENVISAKLKLKLYFNRSDMADNTPDWLLFQLTVPGLSDSYVINAESNFLLHEVLKYCINPLIRNQIWLSSRQVGGRIIYNYKSSNYRTISEIRNIRKDIANNFDFENYVSFIFNTKSRMAKSLDDVINLLEEYKSRLLFLAENEFEDLNNFAIKEKGLKELLMPWDNDYIHHSYYLSVIKCPWSVLETNDIKFNLNLTIDRIFTILQKMFGATFTQTYIHDNELSYTISKDKNCGELIFKINKNSHGKFINVIPLMVRTEDKSLKVSNIVINLTLDNANIFNCLEIVAYLGKILEYHLSLNDIEINPLYSGLPPDAVNVSSQFLLHLFMSSNKILEFIFPELGFRLCQDLSNSYSNKVMNMKNNITCLNDLYVAYFDIEMGLSNKNWQNVQMELWYDFFGSSSKSRFYYPFPKLDEWPCSATDIFSDNVFGGVKKYSVFWTDNIVKQLSKKFDEAKFKCWSPNEDLSPELLDLFDAFQRAFIEQTIPNQKLLP